MNLARTERSREYVAEQLRVIGGVLDRVDQLSVLPADETGAALQALVNVQHIFRLLAEEAS